MIVYGKSGVTFAKDLYYDPKGKVPGKFKDWEKAKAEGFKLVDHFLGTFTGLRDWIENTKEFAREKGYVETMFGRRRRLPDIRSKLSSMRAEAERQAINAPIQGTGSDLTMLSVIQLVQWLKSNNMKSKIIATVHDSIVFDVYIPELHILAPMVKQIMESVHKPYIKTIVPIRADLELGKNYGATFEVELEEVVKISTYGDFVNWNDEQKFHKYIKEVEYLQKAGKKFRDIQAFCLSHGRPWDKILEEME